MESPVRFTLSRFSGFFTRQKAEIIEFGPEGISMLKNGETLAHYPYSTIQSLTYVHFNKALPEWLTSLAGNALARKEARFEIESGDLFVSAGLEMDAAYRSADLIDLFRALYRKGVPLAEKSTLGGRLFLLEKCEPDEVGRKITALRGTGQIS